MFFSSTRRVFAVCAALTGLALTVPGSASSSANFTCPDANTSRASRSSGAEGFAAQHSHARRGNLAVKRIGTRNRRVCLRAPSYGPAFVKTSVKFRIRNTGGRTVRLSRLRLRIARKMLPLIGSLTLGGHRLTTGIAGGSFDPKPPCMDRITRTEDKVTCRLKKIRLKPGRSIKFKVRIQARASATKQYIKLAVASRRGARESSLRDNKAQVNLNVVSAGGDTDDSGTRR